MYYPIIDRLKEIISTVRRLETNEPYIIDGVLTSQTGGTWEGDYSDIYNSFADGNYCILHLNAGNGYITVPLIDSDPDSSDSAIIYYQKLLVFLRVKNDNTFIIVVAN